MMRSRILGRTMVWGALAAILFAGLASHAEAGKGRRYSRMRSSSTVSRSYQSSTGASFGNASVMSSTSNVWNGTTYTQGRSGLQYYPGTNLPISVGPNGLGTVPGTLGIRVGPMPSTQFSPSFHNANPMNPPVYIVR